MYICVDVFCVKAPTGDLSSNTAGLCLCGSLMKSNQSFILSAVRKVEISKQIHIHGSHYKQTS